MEAWRRFRAGMAALWRDGPFWRGLDVDWRAVPAVRPRGNSIGLLLRYFRPRWPAVAWVILNVMFASALGVLPPLFIRNIIDVALPHHDMALLIRDALYLVGAHLLIATTTAIGGYLFAWATNGVVRDVRQTVFDRLLHVPLWFLEGGRGADAASRTVNDVGIVGGNSLVFNGITGIFSTLLATIGAVTTLVSTLIVMFRLNAGFAVLVVALLPPFLVLARFAARWLYAVTRRQYEVLASLSRRVGRATRLSEVLALRLFGQDEADVQGFQRDNAALADLGIFARNISRGFGNFYAIAPAVGVALIWWFGAHDIFIGVMQLGTVLAFVAYVHRITTPVQTLSGIFINVRGIQAVGDRVAELLETEGQGDGGTVQGRGVAGELRLAMEGREVGARAGAPLWVVATAPARTQLRQFLCGERGDEAGPFQAPDGLPAPAGLVARHGVLWGQTLGDHLGVDGDGGAAEAALAAAGLSGWYRGCAGGLGTPLRSLSLTRAQELRLSLAAALARGCRLLVVDGTEPEAGRIGWADLACPVVVVAARMAAVPDGAAWVRVASAPGGDLDDVVLAVDAGGPEEAVALDVVQPDAPLPGWWARARGGMGGWFRSLGVRVRWFGRLGRRDSLRRLVAYYYPYWPYWLFVTLMAMVSIGGLSAIAPLFIRMLINQALPQHSTRLLLIGIGMGVLLPPLVHAVTSVISTWAHETMSNRALRDMRGEAYDRVMRRPLGFFTRHTPQELASRLINDVNSIYVGAADISNATWMFLPMLPSVPIMFSLNAHLALLVLVGLLPMALATYLLGQARYPLTARTFEVVSRANHQLARVCSPDGALAVRSARTQSLERQAFLARNRDMASLGLTTDILIVAFQWVVGVVGAGVTALLWWQGGRMIMAGQLSVGTLVAMGTYVLAMEQLHGGFRIYVDLRSVQANCDRVFTYVDDEGDQPGGGAAPSGGLGPVPVSLRPLGGTEATVLAAGGRATLRLPAGVGPLQVAASLLGLLGGDPPVEVGGRPLAGAAVAPWRRSVAVLSGAFPLEPNCSIRESIGARAGQDVQAALDAAGVPLGPDASLLGWTDAELRFRLSLAAALLRPEAWLWVVDARAVPADLSPGRLAGTRSLLYLEPEAQERPQVAGQRPAWGAVSAPQP